MKYVANPVIVDAYVIRSVFPKDAGFTQVICDTDGTPDAPPSLTFMADETLTARYHPKPGDYWVIQADGYAYLNPKEVFERKYSSAIE